MFRIEAEKDLMNAFRPRDRKSVELPEGGLRFPLFVRDYLAWVEPTGVRTHLVFTAPGRKLPVAISFRRDQQADGAHSSRMCDWCHSYGSAMEIGLLTAEATTRRRVGVNLCLDLRCGEKLEDAANRAGRSAREQARELLERMARFADEALAMPRHPEEP